MNGNRKFTERVTLQSDGSCCWRQDTDREYEFSRIKKGFAVCVTISLFIFVFGAVLATHFQDPYTMLFAAVCAAVFMLISILIFGLSALLVDSPGEIYTMSDTCIQTGEGQSSEFFYFKQVKKVTLSPKYIELKGAFRVMRVYVSPKDMYFVRNYILSRVSGDADIVYF